MRLSCTKEETWHCAAAYPDSAAGAADRTYLQCYHTPTTPEPSPGTSRLTPAGVTSSSERPSPASTRRAFSFPCSRARTARHGRGLAGHTNPTATTAVVAMDHRARRARRATTSPGPAGSSPDAQAGHTVREVRPSGTPADQAPTRTHNVHTAWYTTSTARCGLDRSKGSGGVGSQPASQPAWQRRPATPRNAAQRPESLMPAVQYAPLPSPAAASSQSENKSGQARAARAATARLCVCGPRF